MQHFLIRYKSLRDTFHIWSHILTQHLTLVVYHLLQPQRFLFQIPRAFHVSIMNASHTNGIDILILPHFFHTRNPVILHLFLIGEIVESSSLIHTPFRRIVTHHRFTMTRSNNDATTIRHCHSALHLIERNSTFVHSRPYHIATQSQQQLENFLVGLHTNLHQSFTFHSTCLVVGRFKRPMAPHQRTPVLIVDENATTLHRRTLHRGKAFLDAQLIFPLWYVVAPPHPGRNPCHARKFQQCVSSTSSVVANRINLSVSFSHTESIHLCQQFVRIDTQVSEFLHNRLLRTIHLVNQNLRFPILSLLSRHPRRQFHVRHEHIRCNPHHRSNIRLIGIVDRMDSIKPNHVLSRDR